MMKILVSDKIAAEGVEILKGGGEFEVDNKPGISPDELADIIGNYDALAIRSATKVTADIIAKAKNLKVIGRAGVGVDNVDVEAATQRGIIVMNTPGGNTISTAEHSFSMLMALARNVPQASADLHKGLWEKKKYTGVELFGKTLGIIGLGRIGGEVAKRALAFNMKVIAYEPFKSPEILNKMGIEAATPEEIFKNADFITVHSPLNNETRHIINEEAFAVMKKGVRIINCARGGIVDEAALVKAIESGKVAGAALDVFEKEPLPTDSPLINYANIILTPHLGAATTEAQENVALQVAEQIVDYLKNGTIKNAINAPSVEPEVLQQIQPYLTLAEKMGKFISQLSGKRAVKLHIKYSGTVLDYPSQPITTAIVKGFLEPTSDTPVNYVNALPKAKGRGIEIIELKSTSLVQFVNLITVQADLEDGTSNSISGTLFTPTTPRIVIFNDKHFDIFPQGNMIIIENKDVPGIIGKIGTILGNHKINIGQMTWGRSAKESIAVTVINTDQEVSSAVFNELRQQENIISARLLVV